VIHQSHGSRRCRSRAARSLAPDVPHSDLYLTGDTPVDRWRIGSGGAADQRRPSPAMRRVYDELEFLHVKLEAMTLFMPKAFRPKP
jgi:hypothetical protein